MHEQRPPNCSFERAMQVLGDRWTMLILHECFWRVRRFSEMQRNLGIARNILSARLQALVATGLLERQLYRVDPERYEYRLTQKAIDLYPAVVAIIRWGDQHFAGENGPPVVFRHACGHDADPQMVCAHCGDKLDARKVRPEPGPGAETDEHLAVPRREQIPA